jgi:DNA-binding transcriptional ArsR family regulator
MASQTEQQLLVALKHPLRRRILRKMIATDRISPRQLATELKEPLSNVSYHVRVLSEIEAATLVDRKPVRGSVQHFYSSSITAPWALSALKEERDGS